MPPASPKSLVVQELEYKASPDVLHNFNEFVRSTIPHYISSQLYSDNKSVFIFTYHEINYNYTFIFDILYCLIRKLNIHLI